MRASVAAVEPMVRSPITGDALPLLEQVRGHLGGRGIVAVLGERRSGKTTALEHLRARLGDGVRYLDDPPSGLLAQPAESVVVYSCERPFRCEHLAVYRLLPWGTDEALEYLLARHRDRCASVMARLDGHEEIAGDPELWCAVLDALAGDDRLGDVSAALEDLAARPSLPGRLDSHPALQTMRRAFKLTRAVRDKSDVLYCVDPEVLEEAGRRLAGDTSALDHLHALMDLARDPRQAAAASLLHAIGAAWQLGPEPLLCLEHAYLPGVRWTSIGLHLSMLSDATFAGADLRNACLDFTNLSNANFAGAHLQGASLNTAHAIHTNFRGADLRQTSASEAYFDGTDLRHADLTGAQLCHAVFADADLRDASFERANLSDAIIRSSEIAGADFRGADLSGANLGKLPLHLAELAGACLERAKMTAANLSGLALDKCRLNRACLSGSILTNASLRGVSAASAKFRGASAGGLDAEGADLRNADLRRMDFHFGSSRCGRVDSDLASEGTRTGFYTDEYEERHFKSPEEIRVASLRGADLRGAKVADTDFYLVDLREARYDAEQEEHFRRCRAILSARV